MTLVLVEVADEAAMQRLRLQGVRVVGVVTEASAAPAVAVAQPLPQPDQPAPRKWAGALSDADADSLRAHVEQVRSEWERDTQ